MIFYAPMKSTAAPFVSGILLAAAIIFVPHTTQAQGCSDAGFCTLPTLHPEENIVRPEERQNVLRLGLSNGKADNGIAVWTTYLQYGRKIAAGFGVDLKATFVSQSDGTTTSSGPADIVATITYSMTEKLGGIAGVKIPFGDGNAAQNSLSLPMDFQPSLGTLDFIAGVTYTMERLHFALAIQQPVTQNKNQFVAERYPAASPFRTFLSTGGYKRSGDVLLRVSYPISIRNDISIIPSMLPVYHLDNDTHIDSSGSERTISGSRGLTLNINLFSTYAITDEHMIEASIGFPLATRTARPDGLTRSYVMTIEYRTQF